jgi:hypothetical protein
MGLASLFAAELYDQLGEDVYPGGYGPVFAYDYNSAGSGEVYGVAQNTQDTTDQLNLDSSTPLAASVTYPYAYARANTPVPAPMPLFGAAAAFGWARRLRNNQSARSLAGSPIRRGLAITVPFKVEALGEG